MIHPYDELSRSALLALSCEGIYSITSAERPLAKHGQIRIHVF